MFGYAIPFVTAVVLNELRHWRGYFRLLVYLPVMIPPAAAAFLWKWFYTPDNSGLFNAVLHALHLPTSQWLQSPHIALLCLVLFSTWSNMGAAVLVYLASLQGIPGELYDAAEIDGAGLAAPGLARDRPADPPDLVAHADAADRGDHAGLP